MCQALFYAHGPLFTGIASVSVFVVIALLGQWLVSRIVSISHRVAHNNVLGFASSTAGVIYAVLLAFIASAVWMSYNQASTTVNQEAGLVSDLFRDASMLPTPASNRLAILLREYIQTVTQDEWPSMSLGVRSGDKGWRILDSVYFELIEFHPEGTDQSMVAGEMLKRISAIFDARRNRLALVTQGSLHPIVWSVVLLGGLIIIIFCWLFGFEKGGLHAASTTLVAACLGLVVFLIGSLNQPFCGASGISPTPFYNVLHFMEQSPLGKRAFLTKP
jgi:hypothetical protein